MDLHITGIIEASRFEPTKPTYGLRIFSSYSGSDKEFYRLKHSENWMHVAEYVFDDIWPEVLTWGFTPSRSYVMFNDEMADALVREFTEYVSRCEALLVHCGRGNQQEPGRCHSA